MAATHRAPKQWCLSKVESINSFENWKQNLIYTLSLDSNFAPFLADGFTWLKKTRGQPLRGLHNDGESVPLARRLTARQKVNFLELMLGQIANYCPIISRNTLVKNSTSLEFIWQTIRQHFGFQVTGAQFIDFSEIHLAADERPEDLYQRLTAFVEDSLLRANGLTHNGQAVHEDEELTPTLENFLVLTWLRLIHPSLPRLVKQRYGTELRSRTLASIKPEISQALNSLLEEIRTSDDARILRAAVADDFRRPRQSNSGVPRARPRQPRQDKVCPLCKQAGRSMTNHFLSQCTFLPDSDRRFMVKARQIAGILDNDQEIETSPDSDSPDPDTTLPGPDMVAQTVRADFQSLLTEYDTVFDPQFPGYNGAAGAYKAKVNMGPVEPPQRKGRLPQYARDKLIELQEKFDDLEILGVFRRPEDVGITIEYLNPSFLVKKPNGGSRLVTAFSDVGRYSKPQPSLLPDVDSTLRLIAQWPHIIVTDLTSAFYQIPLAKESMKYCGVATPFKGVRVYARSAMGMPGSETALEEVMCRVLGPLLQDGVVAKIADDLYCGGNTPLELLHNWKRVLQALHKCNLRLSAHKTIINPKSTTILGWIWSAGTLSASAHRLNTLATYPVPNTVGRLRSFIGAYKVLSRVIPRCSSYLTPLDAVTAGRTSQESITWSDSLRAAFHNAQKALSSALSITLPRPEDQLWVVTDGAVKDPGIGATLYVTRNNKLHIAGFFRTWLRGTQTTWLPCEVEALSIAAATKHFSPYLIQSSNKACILTDSKPCVQAYEKLCRGEFSASPRVSTFLSVVSRYQASVRHVSGASILQSDFASRNAAPCENETCQICLFIASTKNSVVRAATVQDILQGNARLPFTSRPAWLAIQSECPDLRRTHAHLVQGTRPSKKLTNIKDVKRYLQVASIASDGLLVVQRHDPLSPTRECIIVPRQALDGLLTALHIQLSHPSCHQLKMVAKRYLFALDLDKAVSRVSDGCHSCAAIQRSPTARIDQSTSPPPETVGQSFAADVIKRSRQLIFVLRETVTSYTSSLFLENERHQTLRDAIIKLCVEMRPMDGPPAVIRTDPAPGFKALVNDSLLQKHRITIELGHAKNPNKNPVAERAVQELENELLRQEPLGSSVSPLTLAVATSALNSRIRSRGLSSREMWTQRDQFSNKQLPLADDHIISLQHEQRLSNHPLSERSKAPGQSRRPTPLIDIGDLVYLHSDLNKSRARDRYLVVAIDPPFCNIKKFIGSQLRSSSYHVKLSECFKVPSDLGDPFRASPTLRKHYSDSDDEDGPTTTTHPPPSLPAIPEAIAASTHPPVVNPQSYSPAPASPVDHTMDDFATQSPCPDPSPVEYAAASAVPSPPALRRSSRTRRPPSRFADYDTEL